MDGLFDAFDEEQTLTKEEIEEISKSSKGTKRIAVEEQKTDETTEQAVVEIARKKPRVEEGVHIDASSSKQTPHAGTGTTEKNLISFSVLPPDYVEPAEIPADRVPAKTYPFVLDPFQQKAVNYIEKGESVLVSAHTSAGKTAVAEYAIAKSLRDKQRVIYTSPIKALSNQKYRDLQEEFSDVGLMTGDITINPTATCLIMTTEILRSMLYRGSEVMREVAWVIYDEIHYMRDSERGVVWEETIILLPHKVRFVFLSATIPNSKEFAQWICHIQRQPCHVVYTDYRPTPLQHYLFASGGEGLHLVVDEKGKFREDNFQKAMAKLSVERVSAEVQLNSGGSGKKGKKKQSKKTQGSDVFRIVKLIMEREYDPVIIFSFSRRDCEAYALMMTKLDFTTDDEKSLIERIFRNAMDSLSDDDKKLPQVDAILPLLKRGIGIHHGGLLPILKEVIEILFGEGLLKCLFATETFSMGLNMPAKTVVFTQCRKYDGSTFRWITSGEYIQMSGRAGRRSLDARGIVIQMLSEEMEPQVAKDILYGQADPLNSAFHLKYNMLLNLLRVEEADPEFMIKQSFRQFQNEQIAPGLDQALVTCKEQYESIAVKDEEKVAEYYHISKQLTKLDQEIRQIISQPSVCGPFLNPGRLILISDAQHKWDWGAIVSYKKSTEEETPTLLVLLSCDPSVARNLPSVPASSIPQGEMRIRPVQLAMIQSFSSLRIMVPDDLRAPNSRQAVGKSIQEVKRRFPNGLPVLDQIHDMQLNTTDFVEKMKLVETTQKKLVESEFHALPDRDARFNLYSEKMEFEAKIRHLEREIKQTKSLVLRDDLRRKKRVLRRLGYTNQDNVIEKKGRTACEISTADELLLTEIIFNGVFNDLSVEEAVALCSCLIYDEKKKEEQAALPLAENLHTPIRQIEELARQVAKTVHEANVTIDIEEYVNRINSGIVDAVLAWCRGSSFAQVCKMADTFEGSLIRSIRRLEELLRQLTLSAHAMGNTELETKFEQGRLKIKRDIVFAASLYL